MLRNIYLKEMKDSFRDRRTLLLTVLLPILMMTGLTFFYENMVSDGGEQSYTLAVHSTIDSEAKSIVSGFDNIQLIFSEDPELSVQKGEAHAALIFSSHFQSNIENGKDGTVTLIGDSFSQKSSNLMEIISNQLVAYEREIINVRLQAEGINPSVIQPFAIQEKEISGDDSNINLLAMLIPLIIAVSIGIGAGPAASELFAGEKEKKTMEALLMTPVNRSTMLVAKWLTIVSIGSIIGIITLVVVAFEINFFTVHLKEAVSFDGQAGIIIGLAILISIVYAMFTASILMLTSIIGKTIKEAQGYSTPVIMLTVLPLMIITGIGVSELSFSHFSIPIFNIFSIFKELIFGIVDYEHILITIGSNIVCVFVMFIIGRVLFLKDKWVMN